MNEAAISGVVPVRNVKVPMSKQSGNNSQPVMNISVIILTYNEEIHIRRCIENVSPWVLDVFVLDCFSSDKTVEISRNLGANVVQRPWPGLHAMQFNWALDNLPIKTAWVLRLDADEYVSAGLIAEIRSKLEMLPEDVTGVSFYLRRVFMGREIRRGMPRIKMVRLFRTGKGRCEQRLMDEHIVLLEGRTAEFEGEFTDHNLSDIGWWTAKHNGYALREAVALLDLEFGLLTHETHDASRNGSLDGQAAAKRAKKTRYARLPLFWRAFVYFCYRYVLRGGFLDGKKGFLWHFLQGWWYRTLVDAKIFEIKKACGNDVAKIKAYLLERYSIDCNRENPFNRD